MASFYTYIIQKPAARPTRPCNHWPRPALPTSSRTEPSFTLLWPHTSFSHFLLLEHIKFFHTSRILYVMLLCLKCSPCSSPHSYSTARLWLKASFFREAFPPSSSSSPCPQPMLDHCAWTVSIQKPSDLKLLVQRSMCMWSHLYPLT